MTKRLLSTALLFSLAAPHAAFAHPGHHDHMGPAELAAHLMSSPFHVLGVVMGLVALAGVVFAVRRAKLQPSRKDRGDR